MELFENAKLSFDVESTGEVKGEGRWEGEASEEKDKEKDEEKDLVQDKKEIPKPQKLFEVRRAA